MRTKTVLLTAALSVAGIATSMAQVYSVNAVGYVNHTVPESTLPGATATYSIIANPLNGTGGNLLSIILPPASLPFGMNLYVLRNGVFESSINAGEWIPDLTLNPGEGAIAEIFVGTGATTFTFVGEVPQGTLVNPVPGAAGEITYSLRSSMVPQRGLLQTDLKFETAVAGDQIYQMYNGGLFDIATYLGDGLWLNGAGVEPTIDVAEGIYIENASGATYNWSRTFSVNTP